MSEAFFITKNKLLDQLAAEMATSSDDVTQLRNILKQAPSCNWSNFNKTIEEHAVIDPDSEVAERQKASNMATRPYIRLLCNNDDVEEGKSAKLYKYLPDITTYGLGLRFTVGTPALSDLVFDEVHQGVRFLMPGYYQINAKFLIGFGTHDPAIDADVTKRTASFQELASEIQLIAECQSRVQNISPPNESPIKSEILGSTLIESVDFEKNYTRFMGASKTFYFEQDDLLTFKFNKDYSLGSLFVGNTEYEEYMQLRKVHNSNPGANPRRDFYNYVDIVKITD